MAKKGAAKKKTKNSIVALRSEASTYQYYTIKNNAKANEKLKFNKYDPITKKVQVFKEKKIKKK